MLKTYKRFKKARLKKKQKSLVNKQKRCQIVCNKLQMCKNEYYVYEKYGLFPLFKLYSKSLKRNNNFLTDF